MIFNNGKKLGNRRQPFDATFGTQRTDRVKFHSDGVTEKVRRQRAIPVFNDSNPNRYWTADNPLNSTKVAGSGTEIRVVLEQQRKGEMMVEVQAGTKRADQ